jgi:hypothetical protein
MQILIDEFPSSRWGQGEFCSAFRLSLRALLLLGVTGFGTLFSYGQNSTRNPNPSSHAGTARKPANGPSARGMHEGVKIHGYWRIDVRNRDGSLATHVEFENSLTSGDPYYRSGDDLLGTLLGGGYSTDTPAIGLNTSGLGLLSQGATEVVPILLDGPCGSAGCLITTSGSVFYHYCTSVWVGASGNPTGPTGTTGHGFSSQDCLTGLSVTPPSAPTYIAASGTVPAASLALTGSVNATSASDITQVGTYEFICSNGAACQGSASGHLYSLTSYTLPSAVAVAAGQTINVSVTFTFQ